SGAGNSNRVDVAQIDPNKLIQETMANMSKVNSYHAKADLILNAQKAQVEGDFGYDRVEFVTRNVDGTRTRTIAIEDESYISTDGGKTWQEDPIKGGQVITDLITGPVGPGMRLAERGPYRVVGVEEVEGASTIHIQAGEQEKLDVWIGEDPKLGKVVRKIHLITETEEGDVDTTVVYSDFNKPVNVQPPR
ncbi:MAG TPA: hypothetical protein VNO70_20020, partial [Blastocatellia bacterium]|nr:hypothetical protein [Blastocatellia bacterium]